MKQRLYIFNRDQLVQLEREERVQKLEGTVDAVESGYVRCLERVEGREKKFGGGKINGDGGAAVEGATSESDIVPRARLGKRKVNLVVPDDEDEEEDDAVGVGEGVGLGAGARVVTVNGHKKVRVE